MRQELIGESQTNELLALLAKSLHAGLWNWQAEGNLSYFDLAVAQILGLPDGDTCCQGLLPCFTAQCLQSDKVKLDDAVSHCFQLGKQIDVEFRVSQENRIKTLHCLAHPEINSNGEVYKVYGLIYESKTAHYVAQVEMLENVISHMPNQVFWKDKSLHYLGCNQAFADKVGVDEPMRVVGKTDFDFHASPDQAQNYRDHDIRIINNRQAEFDIQEPYHLTDGTQGHVLTSKVPLFDKHGEVYGLLGVCTDITERVNIEHKLDEQKRLFEELVNVVPVMVNSFDAEGNCNLWNKTCESVLGYSFKEAGSTPNLMELFYPDPVVRQQVLEDIASPNGEFREYPVVVKNGQVRSQLWSNFSLFNGMMIGCGLDINEIKETRKKLEIEQQHFKAVIENMPMGYHLWEMDNDGELRLIGGNSAADVILGVSHKAMLGETLQTVYPKAADKKFINKCKAIASYGSSYEEESGYQLEGQQEQIIASVYFQCYAGAMVVIFRDTSELHAKEAEMELANKKLKLVTQGSQDGFWHWMDPVLDKVEWSDNFFVLLGYEPQEFDPSFGHFQTLLHPDDLRKTERIVDWSAKTKKEFDIEYRLKQKSGTYRWFRAKGRPYYDQQGNFVEMAGSVTDIDNRVKISQSLKEAKESAELATKAKSEFLANMSHEIRTPMNAILGGLQLLERSHLEPSLMELTTKASYSAKTLLTIINDILDYSKIEENKLDLELAPFSFLKVVDSVRSDLATAAAEKEIDLLVGGMQEFNDGWVGDFVRVRQILLNLVSNAVKFTKEGAVEINLAVVEQHQHQAIQFEISDSGIGMSEKAQQRIFERFTQADSSTTRKFGGTGLGMSITVSLIKMMGGDIQISSIENLGTTVTVILPLEKTTHVNQPEDTEIVEPPAMKSKRILIAEDIKINQVIIESMLQPTLATLNFVDNGRQAVEAFKQAHYDIVLMDIHMPEMDGLEAHTQIKAINDQVPVIALTANVMVEDVKTYLKQGFASHIGKAIELNNFYKKLADFV